MEVLEFAALFITPLKDIILVFLGLCLLNIIFIYIPYGVKIPYFKKWGINRVSPIYELEYLHHMKGYYVKKYNLCWNKDYAYDDFKYFLIPFSMLFFKYSYVEENEGYGFETLPEMTKCIVEDDLKTFYESKKIEAQILFEKRSEKRILTKNK